MRFHLEVKSGSQAGLAVELQPGRVYRVGREADADIAVPEDSRMSGLHFAVKCDNDRCRIRDANSTNGTLVNGERITETELKPEDTIRSGRTDFCVRFSEGESELAGEQPVEEDWFKATISDEVEPVAAPAEPEAVDETVDSTFIRRKCSSGISLFLGCEEEPTPSKLARLLARDCPLHVIVDFNRAEQPIPEGADSDDFLFDWVPEPIRPECSPALLPAERFGDIFDLIDAGWGKNGISCLFSQGDAQATLEHVRGIMRGPSTDRKPGEMLGFCWPNVIDQLLSNFPEEDVEKMLVGIDAVLLESEQPHAWRVFSGGAFREVLEQLGFREVEEENGSKD